MRSIQDSINELVKQANEEKYQNKEWYTIRALLGNQ